MEKSLELQVKESMGYTLDPSTCSDCINCFDRQSKNTLDFNYYCTHSELGEITVDQFAKCNNFELKE